MMNKQNLYPQISGPLFEDVQNQRLFSDSKTFVDFIPMSDPNYILTLYAEQKKQPDFKLNQFIEAHFTMPHHDITEFEFKKAHTMEQHIESLWPVLTYGAHDDQHPYSSLIHLPYPFIVPGGRFREIYYWDSYFTSEGLACSGHIDRVVDMAKNFGYLIDQIGHIPNGNRVYYKSRSQPPFFCSLLDIVARYKGIEAIRELIPALEKEYQFWMNSDRAVLVNDNVTLNRYWDDNPAPRPESYREDIALYKKATPAQQQHLYRNIRATCESGWDFSSRWLKDPHNLATLYTTELIPVDLNSLLYYMENKLSEYFMHFGQPEKALSYAEKAALRKTAINQFCWDATQNFYVDYNFKEQQLSPSLTLAAAYPLFFKIASPEQAKAVAKRLQEEFLYPGGLVTTLIETEQQWDKPNGWAPLHWIAIQGLKQYGFDDLAQDITNRWLTLNRQIFKRCHKMIEKYNVCGTALAGGGEYPLQDGFGWTNGVAIALIKL